MKRLFLSGGSGFIGKNIIEQLSDAYTIVAPTHAQLQLDDKEKVDAFFEHEHFDVIIHTAIKPYHRMAVDMSEVGAVNTAMYFNLKRQVQNGQASKMLVTGTGSEYAVYKPNMTEEYFGENVPKNGGTLSRYKIALDIENTALPIYNMRLFGLFGKYEKYDMRFISSNILRALYDMPITVSQNRSFCYLFIDDFIPILTQFIEKEPMHKSYNITTNRGVALVEILAIIREVLGKNAHPIIIKQNGTGEAYCGGNKRLKSEFETHFTPIRQAIGLLATYYKQNLDKFDKALLDKDQLT